VSQYTEERIQESNVSERLDWAPEQDGSNIRNGAQELQAELHRRVYDPYFSDVDSTSRFLKSSRTYWRRKALEKFEIFQGRPIGGDVMEIGAGTGWCSALLSKKPTVRKVYAVEYDRYAIDELMPKVFTHAGADNNKIARVYGSFNHMPQVHGQLDFVVSIGAIHHSENLLATLQEVSMVLKPGGYFLAMEPCESNSLGVREQKAKEDLEDAGALKKYGRRVTNKENSDHFYRLCEFEAAGYWAHMDAWAYIFDTRGSWFSSDRHFRNREVYDGFRRVILRPYFAMKSGGVPVFDQLLLIMRKPD
jgi:SAM-dependent methyltransferase